MTPDPTTYHDLRRRGGIADLSDRVQLRLTGADRVRFLNGQVTADVRKLTTGRTMPACVTTAKGKLSTAMEHVTERRIATITITKAMVQ